MKAETNQSVEIELLKEEIQELKTENQELKRQLTRQGKRSVDDEGDSIPLDKMFSGDL